MGWVDDIMRFLFYLFICSLDQTNLGTSMEWDPRLIFASDLLFCRAVVRVYGPWVSAMLCGILVILSGLGTLVLLVQSRRRCEEEEKK